VSTLTIPDFFGTLSNLPSISPKSSSNSSITSTSTPVPTPAPSPPSLSPVEIFKRGIKRDPSVYPTLKDELRNDNWHHSFVNQARAQDVHDVLDDKYVPNTTVEKDLFQEKQKFHYAILESKVELQRVRQSFESMKGHLMPKRHILNYENIISSSVKILGYITSAKIGDGSWHGTAENFTLNWQE
jgi:hypothetical protein